MENETQNVNEANLDNNDNDNVNVDVNLNASDNVDVNDNPNVVDDNVDFHTFDIFDPRNWDALDSNMINILVLKGPKRDFSITKGPKDKYLRRFSATYYTKTLPNGEKYWIHLNTRIKEHETSMEHVKNINTWYDLRLRLQKNKTIDNAAQKQLEKEKVHWRQVLLRIISIVKFLAKHNLAFRGTNEKLYEDNNGNFLGLFEMLAEFDMVSYDHIQRITNEIGIHKHYIGHRIQNELILLLSSEIKSMIIKKIKNAKYFSIILDCTPDISHQEQMTIILRYVDVSSNVVCIEESFLGFLDVNDTTGQGLFDVLQNELNLLDLDINNVRGQGYDNGSNMKGKHQGVQKKLLDINSRAFYTPCGCHSLNLTLCDMANTCGKAKSFFGTIQRIYTIFANSTKRWQILKDNVKGLTPKSLSSTRWESRVDSVKAIRFQIFDIQKALLQVAKNDNYPKITSEAKSLAKNELGNFEFILALVIWYEMLNTVNLISKQLQSKDMLIDEYRENGFLNALQTAKDIALEMGIDPIFPKKREPKIKKHFDEISNDTSYSFSQSAQEKFRVKYFIYIVDQAITSLTTRFEQYQQYDKIFGFLFNSEKLLSLDDITLKSCCMSLETSLKKDEQSDIDGNDLYVELKLLLHLLPKEKLTAIDILNFLKRVDCFPITSIAYRIMLTIPVTVASAERSFSKLKILKSYLRSTMTQERLNGLALMAIERNMLDKVTYEDVIENFISSNIRRMTIFKYLIFYQFQLKRDEPTKRKNSSKIFKNKMIENLSNITGKNLWLSRLNTLYWFMDDIL
ncbi:uncharacterized protein LOC111912529 [Lactuca sativa]|uniref:uncharacterized protein LOC111912529 n=1 Tax=Lactuca sativa TaxID=4236 RepID=UPI0022AF8C88|nr:uncharacterized protein LOC111912529 [Lactuca sativa]